MAEIDRNLVEFEDSIRLEALTIREAIDFKLKSKSDVYIVGRSIQGYLHLFGKLGFKHYWMLHEMEPKEYLKILDQNSIIDRYTALMYTYIDYVFKETDASIMVFLPEKSSILASGRGHTFNEITRILTNYSEEYSRVNFVTGFYENYDLVSQIAYPNP